MLRRCRILGLLVNSETRHRILAVKIAVNVNTTDARVTARSVCCREEFDFLFTFLPHARSAAGSSTESAFPRRVGAWVQIDGAMLRHSHRCYRYNRCERAVETERSKSKCYSDVFRPSYAAKWPKHTPPTGYTDCSV